VSGYSKAYIGLGVAFVLLGAISVWRNWGIWSMHIGYIVAGMFFILTGIIPILGGRGEKVIRGLRFGLAGVAIAFMVVGLVLLSRSL
jgi:hypothetical protein